MPEPACVIGTNSWGSRAYERLVRGSYVDDRVIASTVDTALAAGLDVFDTAEDYGLGYAQRLMGRLRATRIFRVSAKYTPTGRYKPGQVHAAFDKDCQDLGTSFVDYYWLHLPNDVDANLMEVIDLYQHGRVGRVGISNFNLQETRHAKRFLEVHEVPLYGVQNHFSLLDRSEERSGMLAWCRENGVSFWGWAVLEEGFLAGTKRPRTMFDVVWRRKLAKLGPLYETMGEVGGDHGLSVAQVAVAYCVAKGVVPVCGCRKPYQVEQLVQGAEVALDGGEVGRLERAADATGVTLLRSDEFRFAVRG